MCANRRRWIWAAWLWGVASCLPLLSASPARALIADVSDHLIAITTAFSGAELLLFGAIEDPRADVVAVVTGPSENVTVWRKSRLGVIWVNHEAVEFRDAPSYFAVAATRPIDAIADEATRRRHALGVDSLRLELASGQPRMEPGYVATFRDALVRRKQAQGLYGQDTIGLRRIGPALFRADIQFPANVQPGSYKIEVFEFVDGYVTSAQSSALSISKVGIEADIFDFAREQSALYGLASIVIALTAGWAASAAFRRS